MTRSPLLIPALAVALLVVTPIEALSAATPEARSASIEFHLPASNGLRAYVKTFNGEVTLEIKRKGRFVSYEVQGESTEAGLTAQFGQLGLIDVAFKPTKMRTERPPKGCKGPPSRWGDGLFIGTIEFTGEREYVRVEETKVKGTMSAHRESEWQCPARTGPMRLPGPPQPSTFDSRENFEAEEEEATLAVSDFRCQCFFAAYSIPNRERKRSRIYGAKLENQEGMAINRATFADAGASAFVFDHAAGIARVHPPQPFSGHGIFKRRPHGRDFWRSTIRVPLLGADPLNVRGRGYQARLVRALPGD